VTLIVLVLSCLVDHVVVFSFISHFLSCHTLCQILDGAKAQMTTRAVCRNKTKKMSKSQTREQKQRPRRRPRKMEKRKAQKKMSRDIPRFPYWRGGDMDPIRGLNIFRCRDFRFSFSLHLPCVIRAAAMLRCTSRYSLVTCLVCRRVPHFVALGRAGNGKLCQHITVGKEASTAEHTL